MTDKLQKSNFVNSTSSPTQNNNVSSLNNPVESAPSPTYSNISSPTYPQDWQETTLGEVCEIKGGKRLPKGETLVLEKTSHPYIRITDLENNQIKKHQLQFVTDEAFQNISRYIVNTGDVIVSIVGSIGFVAFIDEDLDNASLTENCVKFVNLKNLDSKFLYYFLISKNGQEEIAKNTVGAVQKKLPIYGVQNIQLLLPPLPEQKAIASVLSSFDDKIELLREQNKTLEEMGQNIFKEWFLPSRPSVGRTGQAGGKYGVDNPNDLPEDWRIGKLGDICEITSGKRPENISDTKIGIQQIPVLGATKIMGYVDKYLFDGKTLVIGRVGTHGEVQRFNEKIFPSDNTLVLKSDNFIFVYQILKSIDYVKMNRGGVQPLITQTDLKNYEIIIPSNELLKKFKETINPVFEKIDKNNVQIQFLARTRDELLPKLMSGHVRVNYQDKL